jgi:hypothetical protein
MRAKERIVQLGRSRYIFPLVSLLLLAPCYWQPRLQAGDLSSHIYNAWLAQLIESGRTQGLMIVNQTTNVLFDLMLSSLFRLFGAEAAQRIGVSVAVLVFTWGAFAFVRAVGGRKPWHLLPCIAMLAYGWVFHMGFFNFYLSLGLCFWAMAVMWEMTPRRIALAFPIFLLAYAAHALPVLWAVGLLVYVGLARRLHPFHRALLTSGFVIVLVAAHAIIARIMYIRWSPVQITLSTGLDQVWVFDTKYYVVLMGLLAVWALMFLGLVRLDGPREVVGSLPFQLCVLSAAAVLILPDTVLIPGFLNALSYIAERMSLGVAVCVCAMLGTVQPRISERWALAAVALVFFGFVYVDERALNSFEDRMEYVVAQLPAGQRVVSALDDSDSRFNSVRHMIDRVCLERCFSYGNYEPSTAQFRIRAKRHNPYVTSSYTDSCALQDGRYIVRNRDLPIYELDSDRQGRLFLKGLKAGMCTAKTPSKVLDILLPGSLTGPADSATRSDGPAPPASPSGSTPPTRRTSTSRSG